MLTLLFILAGIIGCNNDTSISEQDELLGTWELTKFENQTSTITITDLDNSGSIVITFNEDNFEGNTGRNTFFGDYTEEEEVLMLTEYNSTEINESEWGQKFTNAIVSTYSTTDNYYHILYTIYGTSLKIEYEPNRFMFFKKL